MIVAVRVDSGKIGRERRDVVIILAGIIRERGTAQFATGPGEIKRMRKQMFGGDLGVNGVEMLIHWVLRIGLVVIVTLMKREHFFVIPSGA